MTAYLTQINAKEAKMGVTCINVTRAQRPRGLAGREALQEIRPMSLPVELIKTPQAHFVFDSNKVTFFKVDNAAYDVLSLIKNSPLSADETADLLPQYSKSELCRVYRDVLELQSHGMLCQSELRRGRRDPPPVLRELLTESMEGITISITSQCNLGCAYCLYGGTYDKHNKLAARPMTWDVLKSSMDFLHKHSRKSQSVRINYFGGEPLLAHRSVRRSLEYFKSLSGKDASTVIATVSSNGTVMSNEILDFLLDYNIYIQVSLDGGKITHDTNRRFKSNGRGSYSTVMRNLARIRARDETYYRTYVRVKAVLTHQQFENDETSFFQDPLMRTIMEEGHFNFIPLQPHFDIDKDEDYFHCIEKLGKKLERQRHLTKLCDIPTRLTTKERALYEVSYLEFFDCQLVNLLQSDRRKHAFTKCCHIGVHDAVVAPDGDIYVCIMAEKGENFVVGNTLEGHWNYDNIEKLNRRLYNYWPDCSECFLQQVCDLCYEKLSGVEGEWDASRKRFCKYSRKRFRLIFRYMLGLLEYNPQLWKDFERIAQKGANERMH